MEPLSEVIDGIVDDYKINLKYFIPQHIEHIKSNLCNADTPLFTIVFSLYTANLFFMRERYILDNPNLFPNYEKFKRLISFNPATYSTTKDYLGEIFDSQIILNTELVPDTILLVAHNESNTNVVHRLIYLDESI